MLLNLSRGKQDFIKEVVESFANKSGQSALCDALFSSPSSKDRSFLGNDDIGNLTGQVPDPDDLARYDTGKLYISKEMLFIVIHLYLEAHGLNFFLFLPRFILAGGGSYRVCV